MNLMEKLYNRGFLSYPRTETTQFNPNINLKNIVVDLEANQIFGSFAKRISSGEMWSAPGRGKIDDRTHPPIHPVKNANREQLSESEWKVYELLAKHFLASISKDAVGTKTQVVVNVGEEEFSCKGITVE
jgi:DNA topoisomerase-3